MTSVTKALSLLAHFSTARPEIGLSQLCRLAGRDKATTYRHLQALETAGFVEQNPMTKHYRLGPAVMQLAQLREATVPRKDGAKPALTALADATGETAHVTVLSGQTLYGLCECESPHHSIRAVIDINTFPLHATASGLSALAFGPSTLFNAATRLVDAARSSGFGRADRIFETEIQGLSTPVFDHSGQLAGAVAVASVAARFDAKLEQKIKTELITAARNITRNWGGVIPAQIEAAWADTLSHSNTLETSS